MTNRTQLLDHGYLEEVEHWGSDERIIESARMSTGGGFKGWGPSHTSYVCTSCGRSWGAEHVADEGGSYLLQAEQCCADWKLSPAHSKPGDERLLGYLYRNKHATPFEMAGLTIEVQAPIFVFRQWHRHRTQSYNEASARYMPLPDLNYIPTVERLMVGTSANKQAGTHGDGVLTVGQAQAFRASLSVLYDEAEDLYQSALKTGVPKELARVHLPVGRYSVMRASANLRNWLAFMTLRADAHAQHEIRVYADAVGKIIEERFPRTWELFVEGRGA